MIPEVWRELTRTERHLSDEEFLQQFQPLLEKFLAREPHLARCAQTLSDLYDQLEGCRVLEPASGCDVLPSILRRLGCEAVGLEAEGNLAARYCGIKGLPLLLSSDWTSAWTDAVFDLVVVAGYATSPDSSEWAHKVTEWFCENAFYQVSNGAELVLFDLRYVAPLTDMIRLRSWPIDWENIRGRWCDAAVFFRHGTDRPRRKRGQPDLPAP